jgi:hypothetical protein
VLDGRTFHFRLAGINNQNFLMTDEETGSWWQQITGKAIFGPEKGQTLEPVPSDELTFGLWKQESPAGQVLSPVAKYAGKYESNWEPEVQKLPVVISFPGTALKSRDVVVGLESEGESRAYPLDKIIKESPIQDRFAAVPVLLVVGPDGKSVRAFVSRVNGADVEFFRLTGDAEKKEEANPGKNWTLIDSASHSEWNFQGCAVAGAQNGKCLERLNPIKDYWFDWRNYHPRTTIFGH